MGAKESPLIGHFVQLFTTMNREKIPRLAGVYADDICFIDPFHQVEGLAHFSAYMASLFDNLSHYEVKVEDVVQQSDCAFITWQMRYQHSAIKRGKMIEVDGASKLLFHDKIYWHQDYFDAGSMMYEHLPVLGTAVRWVKKRVSRYDAG